MRAQLPINIKTDFTRASFVRELNRVFGKKSSGTKFNMQDVQQYVTNAKLPDRYGGHIIKRIDVKRNGITLIRIEDWDYCE